MLNTIVRTGEVLELFTRERPEWGVTEVADHLGVPKSNAHEVLSSLASIDLLRRTGRSRYRLGWRIVMMARDVVDAAQLRRHAPSIMNALARETGETTHVAIWDGRRLVFIARVLADTGLDQDHARAGTPIEAHCTASGKLLLAELSWDDLARRVDRTGGLKPRTVRSIRSLDVLTDQLRDVRRNAVATNEEEADDGVAGIAVPVLGADGHAIASLGVSMSVDRLGDFRRRHERLLRRLAKTLSTTILEESAAPSGRSMGAVGA